MNNSEFEALFKDMESDRVERKPSISDPNSIRQAICAFANDLPGHEKPGIIFIGVNDDGSCKGLQITSVLLRTNSLHYDSWTIMRNLQCSSEVIGQEKKLDKQGKYLIVSV